MPVTTERNKLAYGFSRVHHAVYTEGLNGAIGQWATPNPILGAVTLSLKPSGESTAFYADNGNYYNVTQDNGFTGDLSMAKFPEEFLIDVLGWVMDKNGMLVESANAHQKPFALLFEVAGTNSPLRVVLYNCTGSKPVKDYQTSETAAKLSGETMTITASPLDFGWITTAKASITRSDNPEAFNSFFDEVLLPQEPDAGP